MSPIFVFDCVQKSPSGEVLRVFPAFYETDIYSVELVNPHPSVFDPNSNFVHFLIFEDIEYQMSPMADQQCLRWSDGRYKEFFLKLCEVLSRPVTGLTLKAGQEFHWGNPAPHGLPEDDKITFKASCLIDFDTGVIADRVYHGLPCVKFDRMIVRTAYRDIDVKESAEPGAYVVCDLADFQADVRQSLPSKYQCQYH